MRYVVSMPLVVHFGRAEPIESFIYVDHFQKITSKLALVYPRLNKTGHMSFKTGQDQTPKFAGQV